MQQNIMDIIKPVWGTEPKNWTGAASTGDYVSLKGYTNLTIFILSGAWAGGTAAVTVEQATAVAGTGTKALALTEMWMDTAATGTFVKTAVTSNTFNLGTANSVWVIELDARSLDIAGGFDCVTVKVATPGANADFYGALYVLHGARYQGGQPMTLSGILD
jgi:hypothetical protein